MIHLKLSNRLKRHLYFWVIPLVFFLTDIILRFKTILRFNNKEFGFYILSIVFSLLIYKGIHFILFKLFKLKNKILYYIILSVVIILYLGSFFISYSYFYELSIMPNYYAIEYIKDEPAHSLLLLKDSLFWYHYIIILFFFTFFFFLLYNTTSEEKRIYNWPWYIKPFHFILCVILLFGFNNNVRFYDQCFVHDVNTISFSMRIYYNKHRKKVIGASGLLSRNRILLKKKYGSRDYNVLLMIGESLRKQNMSLYGYHRNTTPFLSMYAKKNPDQFVYFRKCFTVSTTTTLAAPCILNGAAAVQSGQIFHSLPLFWEYAKTLNYETFYLTSQSHEWKNFKLFFDTPDIDYLWNRELSGLPLYNDWGINDGQLVEKFIKHLTVILNKKKRFAGLLHFNTNHYPYDTPAPFRKWKGIKRDLYDNTVLYQDHLFEKIFEFLKKRGELKNTVIIFSSDHGEAFKEHGYVGHKDCYYLETTNIPLFIYVPKRLTRRFNMKQIKRNQSINVSTIDIIPTILEILQIKNKKDIKSLRMKMMGSSLFDKIPLDRELYILNGNDVSNYKIGLSMVKRNLHYLLHVHTLPYSQEVYNIYEDKEEKNNLWSEFFLSQKKAIHCALIKHKVCKDLLKLWRIELLCK